MTTATTETVEPAGSEGGGRRRRSGPGDGRAAGGSAAGELVDRLLDQVKAEGLQLLGEDGVIAGLTKSILERALDEELTDHLGYERGDPAGRGSGNSRNGTTPKTVLTDVGAVDLDVPRDRNATFEPAIGRC